MSIGNQLKKARQKKHLNIEDVYKHTKIHPRVLTALEDDKFQEILNASYVRSFLSKYAAYLGLNPQEILAEFNSAAEKTEQSQPESPTAFQKDVPLPRIGENTNMPSLFGIIIGAIVAIAICIFLFKGTVMLIHKASQAISAHKKQARIATPAASVKAAVKKEKPSSPKPQKKKASQQTAKKSQAGARLPVPQNEKLNLTITATDYVWLQLKVDGNVIFQDTLHKGVSEVWQANENFTIWTGKAKALKVSLNGAELSLPAEGVAEDILITREGVRR